MASGVQNMPGSPPITSPKVGSAGSQGNVKAGLGTVGNAGNASKHTHPISTANSNPLSRDSYPNVK